MSDEYNGLNQAHAQMASIREMVAALECDYNRLEELRDGWKAEGVQPHREGGPECCDQCGAETESAYGEDA